MILIQIKNQCGDQEQTMCCSFYIGSDNREAKKLFGSASILECFLLSAIVKLQLRVKKKHVLTDHMCRFDKQRDIKALSGKVCQTPAHLHDRYVIFNSAIFLFRRYSTNRV